VARSRNFRVRRLERETGIEPATNSLEGCDSTTELLPPSCHLLRLGTTAGRPASCHSLRLGTTAGRPASCHSLRLGTTAGRPASRHSLRLGTTAGRPASRHSLRLGTTAGRPASRHSLRFVSSSLPASALLIGLPSRGDLPKIFARLKSAFTPALRGLPAVARWPKRSARKLVAREGLEPSKPLGRQIYSLLRLTAPQPRQLLFGVFDVCVRFDSPDGAGGGI
jgi:hypothetical protein